MVIKNGIDERFNQSGLTKVDLASRSGLSYQNVIRTLSYKYLDNTKLSTIVKLAIALGVTVDELIGFEELKEKFCGDVCE